MSKKRNKGSTTNRDSESNFYMLLDYIYIYIMHAPELLDFCQLMDLNEQGKVCLQIGGKLLEQLVANLICYKSQMQV